MIPGMTDRGGLARPLVTSDEAAGIAARLWGRSGPVTELGSQQDRNFRIEGAAGTVVLKLANAATVPAELEAQQAALEVTAAAGLRVPGVVRSLAGAPVETVEVGGQRLLARVLTYVDGTPLLELDGFDLERCRLLGATAGAVVAALADLSHPGADRRTQWDLRVAGDVLASLASHLPRPVRGEVLAATGAAAQRLQPPAADPPPQGIPGDPPAAKARPDAP